MACQLREKMISKFNDHLSDWPMIEFYLHNCYAKWWMCNLIFKKKVGCIYLLMKQYTHANSWSIINLLLQTLEIINYAQWITFVRIYKKKQYSKTWVTRSLLHSRSLTKKKVHAISNISTKAELTPVSGMMIANDIRFLHNMVHPLNHIVTLLFDINDCACRRLLTFLT